MAAADAALYRAKSSGRDQVQMISTTRGLSAVSGTSRGINGAARDGAARDGMERDGIQRDGQDRDGAAQAEPSVFQRALTSLVGRPSQP